MNEPEFTGISYMDGPVGRRAVIEGTGLDVWEIIATQQYENLTLEELAASFPWLTLDQIEVALAYYRAHPEEIDKRVASELAGDAETMNA